MTTEAEAGLVVTHSLIKSMRRCPRITLYKHHDLLAPREISKPLKRGTWMHELLEAYYLGEDWKAVHRHNTEKFSKLFDEEKDKLGDLPKEIGRLFRSYLWHYKNDAEWKVHEVEFKLEAELPGGQMWQGKSDMLIEDDSGLWIVDHKTHKVLPSLTQRLLDQQSILYIWAARENGIPVQGFIWNYLRTNAPREVRVTKQGTVAKNMGQTDYPTAYTSLVQQFGKEGLDRYKPWLRDLAKMRYQPDAVQMSPFFQRHVMEKNEGMIERALSEASHTADRYAEYDFEDRDSVERVPDRSCDWCSYKNLCTTELIGGNADNIKRQEFMQQDPFHYYGASEDPIGGDE
jgi:hypothetical protein